MVCDHDGGLACDCFVGDGFCEIDGEEDGVAQSTGGYERCFEEEASVIPRAVCEGLRIAVEFVSISRLCGGENVGQLTASA